MGSPKSFEKITTLTSVTTLSSAVYNPSQFYSTNLTNGALTSGTSWTGANDFASTGNKAVYTHSSGAGTYTQAVTSLARTGRSEQKYRFIYTVSSPSGTAPTVSVSTAFAGVAAALIGLSAAGTYQIDFVSAANPAAFVLSGTSTTTGAASLDDLELYEFVQSSDIMQVKRAVISVETASVNFTIDGSMPTVSSGTYQGHLLDAGDVLTLNEIDEIRKFRCINSVASNGAVLKVTYSF